MRNQTFENPNWLFEYRNEEMTDGWAQEHAMNMVRQCAAPAEGLSIKAQIRQAARTLKWDYERTRRLWYGNAVVKVEEWETLKGRVRAMQRKAAERERLVNEIRQKVERAFPHEGGGTDAPIIDVVNAGSREDS